MTITVGGAHGVTFANGQNVPAAAVSSLFAPYITDTANTMVINARTDIRGSTMVKTPAGEFTTPQTTIEFLVVGGGAGGGDVPNYWSEGAGGGNAGAVKTGSATVALTGSYAVTVGTGGGVGGAGTSSTFFGQTAAGGSGTGAFGSGWGGGGGGSGAGGAGGGPSYFYGGNGGNGVQWSGNGLFYAGGGGGGQGGEGGDYTGDSGAGGSGVGGKGARNAGRANATTPTANTGSGGGGAAGFASQFGNVKTYASAGAAGVVIIKYPGTTALATGGTITNNGTHTFHTFTTSGTFAFI